MDPAIWIALFAGLVAISASTVAPFLMASAASRRDAIKAKLDAEIRREDKEQDYARQDEVARRLYEYTRTQAQANKLITDKIDVVHTLVNSNLTLAKESELKALVALAQMTREIVDLRVAQHLPENPHTIQGLMEMDNAVKVLREEIAERNRQTQLVKEQEQNQAKTAIPAPVETEKPPGILEPIKVEVVNPEPVHVKIADSPKT